MSKINENYKKNKRCLFRYLLLLPVIVLLIPGKLTANSKNSQLLNEVKISLSFTNAKLTDVFKEIEKQTSFQFSWTEEMETVQGISITCESKELDLVLEELSKKASFFYKPVNNTIAIAKKKEQNEAKKKTLGAPGNISGTITDSETGEALPGASVVVEGTSTGASSDLDGKYTIPGLAPDTYTIVVSFVSFKTMKFEKVKVASGKHTTLDIKMEPATETLGEVVVKGEYKKSSVAGLYAKQKTMARMNDGISADLIKTTSDNNVAQVLHRLPGVSVSSGKFVTVRGLSERYNNVSVNGANMPSTEPNRKNFSFDIIPTGMVDNVVVAKTFTPDMSAEFAGGAVNVNTLSIPEKKFLTLSVGGGVNTNSIGKEFLSGKRYGSDYLLGNKSDRFWFGRDFKPAEYMEVMGGPLATPEYMKDWEGVKAMGAKVPNSWGLYKYTAAPMRNFSVGAGLPFGIDDHKFGIVAGLSYRHEENIENYGDDSNDTTRVQLKYGPLTKIYPSRAFRFNTSFSALGNLGWEYRNHRVNWKNLYSSRFSNSSAQEIIITEGNDSKQILQYNDPQRIQMFQTRLEGEHQLWNKRLKVAWYADYNKLKRQQPDERNIRGFLYNNQYVDWAHLGITDGSFTHIFTGELNETKKNIGLNVEVPFTVGNNPQKIKVGYDANFRDAHYRQYVFNINDQYAHSNGAEVYDFLTQDKFADGTFYYVPWGQNPEGDGYNGKLDIRSVYLMSDFTFYKVLHLSGGVRCEDSHFSTDGIRRAGTTEFDSTRVDNEVHWYPSVNFILNITKQLNLRGSYSKTISRFDFREVSPQRYYDVLSGIEMTGTDTLRNTFVKNYDLRLEWFPAPGEVLSLSVFYKDFTDPIETYVWQNAGHYYSRPINLEEASGKGVELNLRKSLGFIAPATFLKDVYVSGNAMWMKMDVVYEQSSWFAEDSIRSRPLQDMVPYSLNASLSWEGKRLGAALHYGTTGRKLVRTSTRTIYDEYEAPRHVLDLQLRARFLQGRLEFKANASDLLAQPYVTYRNMGRRSSIGGWGEIEATKGNKDDMGYNKGTDWLLKKVKKGSSYSFSVSYKF